MIETDPIGLIANVGFPIGAFLLMWVFATKTLKENTAAIRELCLLVKAKK